MLQNTSRHEEAGSQTLLQRVRITSGLPAYPARLFESIPFTTLLLLAGSQMVQAGTFSASAPASPADAIENSHAQPITRIDAIRDQLIAFLGNASVPADPQTSQPAQQWSNWGNWYNN
jgi:hypothetical protein